MRRWPTSDEKRKEVQDFFHKLGVILIYAGYLEIKGCILLTMKQTMCSFFLMKYRSILKYNEIQW